MFETPFPSLLYTLAGKVSVTHQVSPVCTDNTTTEAQGTGRKRGRSDPDGVDSELGNSTCSY